MIYSVGNFSQTHFIQKNKSLSNLNFTLRKREVQGTSRPGQNGSNHFLPTVRQFLRTPLLSTWEVDGEQRSEMKDQVLLESLMQWQLQFYLVDELSLNCVQMNKNTKNKKYRPQPRVPYFWGSLKGCMN